MPNVVALASEYAPKRLQATLVPTIFAGMGGGAVLSSIVGGALIPIWGWRSVFIVGGVLPLALAVLLIAILPESLRFLAARGGERRRVSAIIARLAPEAADISFAPPAASDRVEGLAVKHLFTEGRTLGTLLLWIPFYMNLLILYFILSWLPSLLRQSGMPVSAGITAVAAFSVGGIVGSVVQGPLMRVLGSFRSIVAEFIVSLALIGIASVIFANFQLMMLVTFLLGIAVQGAQAGLNVLAAMYYPTTIRSTGIGWALGVGRVGSIVGPLIGGAMLAMQWRPQQIFQAGAIPALLAAAAVIVSAWVPRRTSPYHPDTDAPLVREPGIQPVGPHND
jgi:AAHS family 4-hydroxybenzoate transporter-like MFS transporter